MKPTRTADDKVLALLARVARPLERGEIAEHLGWSKQRVGTVVLRLAQEETPRVVITVGESKPGEEGGRPPALYSLPGMEPFKAGDVTLPYYEPHTAVVTPSGREARVVRMCGDFVEIEYVEVRLGHEPRTTVHASLLRAYQPGRERPDPVRILADAE
jgi:hypothetical protein